MGIVLIGFPSENLKIIHVVAFDVSVPKKEDNSIDKDVLKNGLKRSKILKNINFKVDSLNKEIYDDDFIKNNENNFLSLKSKLKLSKHKKNINKCISEESRPLDIFKSLFCCDDNVLITVNFDSCGVSSINFVFNISKDVQTRRLIDILQNTCKLIDKCLFNLFKDDLKELFKKTEGFELSEYLTEHLTYSIVCGDEINEIHADNRRRELFGVAWNNRDYMDFDKKIVDKVFNNNMPVCTDDIFLITKQATLIIRQYYDENFIEAIELFWRQKCLIKKVDFQIMKLLRDITYKEEDLKSQINYLTNTQREVNLNLEACRNTILSFVDIYALLFEKLNNTFNTSSHYSFVKSKMEDCKQIYQQLYNEKQETLLYTIQKIIITLGVLTLITTITALYSPLKELTNLIIFIILLVIIGSIIYTWLSYKYKK